MSFRLEKSVWLPRPIDEVFAFFGDAGNLERMTPPWLSFKILTPRPIDMRAGTLIDYRIALHGIPMKWRTKITTWNPPFEFVDEQLSGPYRRWHHRHTFAEEAGGTRVGDIVDYDVLGGWLVNKVFVERDVRKIFDFRETTLKKLFPGKS
jgi:ligand-binding SRPBCC domain-containing protein